MPFPKVHVNAKDERYVGVHLDGEEKIIPIIDIANKHFKKKAIMKIGAVTPHAKSQNRLVISLTVEELKLSIDLAKLSYNIQTPEVRFAHETPPPLEASDNQDTSIPSTRYAYEQMRSNLQKTAIANNVID